MENKTHRIKVNRGFGSSLGNSIQVLSGEAEKLVEDENWIEVIEVTPGIFSITGDNMTEHGDPISQNVSLGFCDWDKQIENLDKTSDIFQCFGMSEKLKWKNVELDLGIDYSFKASSIKEIEEALYHIQICAYCPGDI